MKRIKVDISTYLVIILSCLSGNFKKIILTMIIIMFHELGHIFFLMLYKINIIKVTFYPFGGITSTNHPLNFNPNRQLIISSAGIINQLILSAVFLLLYKYILINEYTFKLFNTINITLILFNLLPIIPLDGSIILESLFSKYFSYFISNKLKAITSFFFLILFIIYNFQLAINNYIIIFFLIYKLYMYLKNLKYVQNKYILERIMYQPSYHKIKYNKSFNPNKLMQDTYHYFNYVPETKKIAQLFDKHHNL